MDIPLATKRLDRAAALTLLGYAVVLTAVILVAAALLDGTVLLVVVLGLLAAWLVHVALYRYAWGRWRSVVSPLGLHGDGLHGGPRWARSSSPGRPSPQRASSAGCVAGCSGSGWSPSATRDAPS